METFESNPHLLSLEIKRMRSLGYDSIRIPGGKSLGKTKYGGVFAFTKKKNTKIEYLVCTFYNSSFHLKEKKKDRKNFLDFHKDDETPKEIAVREFCEETGIEINPDELKFVHRQYVKDNRLPKNKKDLHQKFYFSIRLDPSDLEGSKEHKEEGELETGGKILIPLDLLPRFLFCRHYHVYKIINKKYILNKTPRS